MSREGIENRLGILNSDTLIYVQDEIKEVLHSRQRVDFKVRLVSQLYLTNFLPHQKTLDWIKLKALLDNKLNIVYM